MPQRARGRRSTKGRISLISIALFFLRLTQSLSMHRFLSIYQSKGSQQIHSNNVAGSGANRDGV